MHPAEAGLYLQNLISLCHMPHHETIHDCIMLTPLNPTFIGIQGYTLFFLFLFKNIDYGTRWNLLVDAVLRSTHNLCFELKYEKISEFLSEKFQFLVVKCSVYLNRFVFVMWRNRGSLAEAKCALWGFYQNAQIRWLWSDMTTPFRLGRLIEI